MEEEKKEKTIKESIVAKIKSGEVRMRPRWHFILETLLVIVGIMIVVLALLYLVSFSLFILRQNGVWFVTAFGSRGIGRFFASLPWIIILSGVVFVAILEILARRYSFVYRKPLLYSLIGIVVIVSAGGFFVSRVGIHEKFFRLAEEKRLPIGGALYERYGMRDFEDVYPGTFVATTTEGFQLTGPDGKTFTVKLSPRTRFPFGAEFVSGDNVVVLGDREGDVIDAFGVRRIEDKTVIFRMRPPRDSMFPPHPF
ncbi:MAG: hypothetical protein V2A55_00665 [Candidatus Jorgensenbacteria bacterium]